MTAIKITRKILSYLAIFVLAMLAISLVGMFGVSYFASLEQPFNANTTLWQLTDYLAYVCAWSNFGLFFLLMVDYGLKQFDKPIIRDTNSKYIHILDHPIQ